MAKRRLAIISLLLYICLCLMPCSALAASTADAREPISPDEDCTLTISYLQGGRAFPGISVKLYQIADVSGDFQYTLTADFRDTGLILNGIQSNAEWNIIRYTLEAYITANRIDAGRTAETDQNGQVHFESLDPGLYLAIPGDMPPHIFFDSALVALPGLGTDGLWQYDISVTAKGEIPPPIRPDEEIQLKIIKLWKGDDGYKGRPKSIEVQIFRNGISYDTVILSAENNWSYTWTAKDDGAAWTVMERNIPSKYSVTLQKRSHTFILTNTLIPTTPKPPSGDPPKTGDTSNILLYTALMYLSGTILVLLGITRKRRRS